MVTRLRYDAAHHFRLALADALSEAGPDAPTLCTGWRTAQLAAHLYVRENNPLSLPGIAGLHGSVGKVATALTEHAMDDALSRHGFQGLVDRFRAGPRPWSPMALPGADRLGNTLEYFVHLHDVTDAVPSRRATADQTNALSPSVRDELWQRMPPLARMVLRRSPVGVQLVRPGTVSRRARIVATRGLPMVIVRGSVDQLALWMFGRSARVELIGDADSVARVSAVVAEGV